MKRLKDIGERAKTGSTVSQRRCSVVSWSDVTLRSETTRVTCIPRDESLIRPARGSSVTSLADLDPVPFGHPLNAERPAAARAKRVLGVRPHALMIFFLLASQASALRAQMGRVEMPPCSSGPEIYRNVARVRDAGVALQVQLQTPINAPPTEGHRRSIEAANAHNALVRQIYAHPGWTPDDVAQRWLNRCKAYESRAHKDEHPVVVVNSLE